MLNINELSIGNYVYSGPDLSRISYINRINNKGEIINEVGFDSEETMSGYLLTDNNNDIDLDGIILTKDILSKLTINDKMSVMYSIFYFENNLIFMNLNSRLTHIKYVHQFQNLYQIFYNKPLNLNLF